MDLEERVKQLEEKLGRQEQIIGRLQEIVAKQVIGGPGRTVHCSLFRLTDGSGKVLAELKPDPTGAGLAIHSGNDESVLQLHNGKDNPPCSFSTTSRRFA